MTINTNAAIAGRLTAEPTLRFTPQGHACAKFTIATSVRRKNGDQWVDGDATFIRVTCWRRTAEHITDSALQAGDHVLIVGDLTQREWTAQDGTTRRDLELDARTVALDLDRFPITARRIDRHQQAVAAGQAERRQQAAQNAPERPQPAQPDPWATQAPNALPAPF